MAERGYYHLGIAGITPDQKTIIGGFKSMSGAENEIDLFAFAPAQSDGNAVAIETLVVQHEGFNVSPPAYSDLLLF